MLEARLELLAIGRVSFGRNRGIVATSDWSPMRCVRPKLRGRDMDLLAAVVLCGLALRRYTLKSGVAAAGLAVADGPLPS